MRTQTFHLNGYGIFLLSILKYIPIRCW